MYDPFKWYYTVITPTEFRKLKDVNDLKRIGHRFRIGFKAKDWTLYTLNNHDNSLTYYEFKDGQKVYHKWGLEK